jgi:N-acetylglucosamine-6-phosphate deacetylase
MPSVSLLIDGGSVLDARASGFEPRQVQIAGDRIAAITPAAEVTAATRLDASGCIVLPGLIDVHVHGAVGHDTMDADPAALAAMARFFARHGVTSFLATTMTASRTATHAATAAVAAYLHAPTAAGARVLGVHLEGPFISPRFPGAQLPDAIRAPDVAEFTALVEAGPVRMITLAPEMRGAEAVIAAARAHGIVAVTGHTAATYDECEAAIRQGVSQATHTYNAMTGLHHRQPGTLGSVLTNDAVFAQLIADNIHVHPAAMQVLARCKGVERTVLITDAMRAAGLPPGRYELGGQAVTLANGACRLDDGTLAGSVLTLEKGLANFLAATGLTPAQGWPAASRTPAASLGLDDLGRMAVGRMADLVVVDATLEVVATVVAGQVVYLRDVDRLRGDGRDDHPWRAGGE